MTAGSGSSAEKAAAGPGWPVHRARDGWAAALLVLAALLTRAAFVYRGGMSEPDSVAMAAGMVMGTDASIPLGDAMVYGRYVSPGMYLVVPRLYSMLFDNPSHMIAFLNWIDVIAASLLVWPLYRLFRIRMPLHAAAGAVVVIMFTPIVWETGTFFHPLIPAVLLLLIAVSTGVKISRSWSGAGYFVVTYLLAAAALVIRAEVVLALAPLLLAGLFSRRPLRNTILTVVLSLMVAATYLLLVSLVSRPTGVERHGLKDYISMLSVMYRYTVSVNGLIKTSVWLGLGGGCALLAGSVWGLIRWFVSARAGGRLRREGPPVLVVLALILPVVLFWIPQPVPILRHFIFPIIGAGWLLGFTLLSDFTPRRTAIFTAALVAINLAVPELVYGGYNRAFPDRAKEPHGSFFSYHRRAKERIERHRDMIIEAALPGEASGASALLVSWEGYAYVLYALATYGFRCSELQGRRLYSGVLAYRYRFGGRDVLLIEATRVYDPEVRAVICRALESAHNEGATVYVPAEFAKLGLNAACLGFTAQVY
jgi:hypothetical protein